MHVTVIHNHWHPLHIWSISLRCACQWINACTNLDDYIPFWLKVGSKHRLRDLTRTSHLESHPVLEGILEKVPALHFHKSGTCWNSVFQCFCDVSFERSSLNWRGSAELPTSCKYSGIPQTCLEYLYGTPKNETFQSPAGHLNSNSCLKEWPTPLLFFWAVVKQLDITCYDCSFLNRLTFSPFKYS